MNGHRLTPADMCKVAGSIRAVDDADLFAAGAEESETAEIREILGGVASELERRAAAPETVDASTAPLASAPDSGAGSALNAIPAPLPLPESPTTEAGD